MGVVSKINVFCFVLIALTTCSTVGTIFVAIPAAYSLSVASLIIPCVVSVAVGKADQDAVEPSVVKKCPA